MMTSSNGTFAALLAFCAGNSLVFFDLHLNKWVTNGEAGDLRRHRAHYDAIVMKRGPGMKQVAKTKTLL